MDISRLKSNWNPKKSLLRLSDLIIRRKRQFLRGKLPDKNFKLIIIIIVGRKKERVGLSGRPFLPASMPAGQWVTIQDGCQKKAFCTLVRVTCWIFVHTLSNQTSWTSTLVMTLMWKYWLLIISVLFPRPLEKERSTASGSGGDMGRNQLFCPLSPSASYRSNESCVWL